MFRMLWIDLGQQVLLNYSSHLGTVLKMNRFVFGLHHVEWSEKVPALRLSIFHGPRNTDTVPVDDEMNIMLHKGRVCL